MIRQLNQESLKSLSVTNFKILGDLLRYQTEFKTNYHQKICIRNLLLLITFIIIHPRDKLLISREIDSGVDHLTFVGLVECFKLGCHRLK